MDFKEITSIEEINGTKFKIRLIEPESNGKAALTHYFHNHKNGVSKFFKDGANVSFRQIYIYIKQFHKKRK